MKICQRLTLSSFRMPCFIHGSLFNFSRTSISSPALTISIEPPSSTNGPPINTKPSTTSSSMNTACSSQSGCSRVLFDGSRFGPAEEIATNVFFIARYDGIYCPQINADLRRFGKPSHSVPATPTQPGAQRTARPYLVLFPDSELQASGVCGQLY